MTMTRNIFSLVCLIASTWLFAAADASPGQGKKPKDPPKHTNRLAKETSPYLRMHAHNPVDWHPWGEAAFAKAKKEGKLIFLSVGYSSCYWCHVMARESFENEEVAALLNKWFVAIKVDREERPDIDQIYMTALEVMGKNGGWPMSMFLTADGRPIIGGTYFPRDDRTVDGKVYNGFKSILKNIHKFATDSPKEIDEQADKMARATAALLAAPGKVVFPPKLDRQLVQGVVDELREMFDKDYGGFGSPLRGFGGPKFPTPCRLLFLLHEAQRTGSKELLGMITLTLDKMATGGIYDQLGGGFHRYSTERTWTVPHFEKMLYDNAQLLEVYAEAYAHTKKPLYRRILQETAAYLRREMLSDEGALYSSQDAETEEEEGRFYVWTLAELQEALPGDKDLQLVRKVYGAEGMPNFEKKYYILRLAQPLAKSAKDLGMKEADLVAQLAPLKKKLFEKRSTRERPFVNRIALTGWSGLAVAGLAAAGKALDDREILKTAEKAADLLLRKQVTKDGRLLHIYGARPGEEPRAAVPAFLDDYTGLVHGLLVLHDAAGDKRWLAAAEKLTKVMIEQHGEANSGGYYFTARDAEKLFARSKDSFDGSVPSGNSQALLNLVQLWKRTGSEFYKKEAARGFEAQARALDSQPAGLTCMADALNLYLQQEKANPAGDGELTLPGQKPGDKKLDPVKVSAEGGVILASRQQVITVTIDIEKGWHIYANPVGNPDLEGADTVVKVAGKGVKGVDKIEYPKGKFEKSPLGKFNSYEGKVVIRVVVQRELESEPIVVSVRYQACNDQNCLVPKTVKLKLP